MSTDGDAVHRVLKLFEELQIAPNDGWLAALHLVATIAAERKMTLEQVQERVAKIFGLYQEAYAKRDAAGSA